MFKFTIRDLLWAMLLVGFGVHSWIVRVQGTSREQVMYSQLQDALADRDEAIRQMAAARHEVIAANERAGRFAQAAKQMQLERFREAPAAVPTSEGSSEAATITAAEAIAIVQRQPEHSDPMLVMDFQTTERDGAYCVHVTYGSGRNESGMLVGVAIGGHCTYVLSPIGEILKVIGGL